MGIDISKIANEALRKLAAEKFDVSPKDGKLDENEIVLFKAEMAGMLADSKITNEDYKNIMGLNISSEESGSENETEAVSSGEKSSHRERKMVSDRMVTLFADNMAKSNVSSFTAVTDDVIKDLKEAYKASGSRKQTVKDAETVINKAKELWSQAEPKNKDAVEKLEKDLKKALNTKGVNYTYTYKMLVKNMVAIVEEEQKTNEQKEIKDIGDKLLEESPEKYEVKDAKTKKYEVLFDDIESKLKSEGKWKTSYYKEAFEEYKKSNFSKEINESYDKKIKADTTSTDEGDVLKAVQSSPEAQASKHVKKAYKKDGDNEIKREIIARRNTVAQRREELANVQGEVKRGNIRFTKSRYAWHEKPLYKSYKKLNEKIREYMVANNYNLQDVSDIIGKHVGPDFVLNGGKDGAVTEADNVRTELNALLGLKNNERMQLTEDDVKVLAEYCGYEVRDKEYGGSAKDALHLLHDAALAGIPAFITNYMTVKAANAQIDKAKAVVLEGVKDSADKTFRSVYEAADRGQYLSVESLINIRGNANVYINGQLITEKELAELLNLYELIYVNNDLSGVKDKDFYIKQAVDQLMGKLNGKIDDLKLDPTEVAATKAGLAALMGLGVALVEYAINDLVKGQDILYEEAVQNEVLRYLSTEERFQTFDAYEKDLKNRYGANANSMIEIAKHFKRTDGTMNNELYHDWLNKASGVGSKQNREELIGAILLNSFPSQEEVDKNPCGEVVSPKGKDDPKNTNTDKDADYQHWTERKENTVVKPVDDTLTVKRKDVKTWEFIIKNYYPGLIEKCGSYSKAVKALKMALACGDKAEYEALRSETDLRKEIKLPPEVEGIKRVNGGNNSGSVTNFPKEGEPVVKPTKKLAGCDYTHSVINIGGNIIHHYQDKADPSISVECTEDELRQNPNAGKEKLEERTHKKYKNAPEEIQKPQ